MVVAIDITRKFEMEDGHLQQILELPLIREAGNLSLQSQQMDERFILQVIEKGDKGEKIFGSVIAKKMENGEALKT